MRSHFTKWQIKYLAGALGAYFKIFIPVFIFLSYAAAVTSYLYLTSDFFIFLQETKTRHSRYKEKLR